MQGVTWIPFPKPHKDIDKCKRWVRACGRMNFTHENVKKWTYLCSKHFVNQMGPTEEHPDPIPASFTPLQVLILFESKKKSYKLVRPFTYSTKLTHCITEEMSMDSLRTINDD